MKKINFFKGRTLSADIEPFSKKSSYAREYQSGFTLIELMIAITLGLLVSAVAIQLFLTSQRSITTQQGMMNLQNTTLFGLGTMVNDIRLANLNSSVPFVDDNVLYGGVVLSERNISANLASSPPAFSIDENLLTRGAIGPTNLDIKDADDNILGSDQLVIQYRVNTPNQFDCEECVFTGLQPDPGQLFSKINDQLGGSTNQCDPGSGVDDPCFTLTKTGPKVTGFISLAANLYGTDDLIFTTGFTITRSCASTVGDGTGWVTFGDGMLVTVDNCNFVGIVGGSSQALATKINEVLGSSTDPGATTFVAVGSSSAWIGQACVNLDFGNCPACLFDVTTWDGPTYSNGNKTATFFFAYKYRVGLQVSLAAFNFFGEADVGCFCTGSPFGQIFSAFISDPDSDPLFEQGTIISGSDFTMIKDPAFSDDFPCVTPPIVT
jgi:prepilin-type N-terminal cleavage/methylation domain-containing protein